MILDEAKKIGEHLKEIRHSIHCNPEISGHEKETSQKVIEELKMIPGWIMRTNIGGYGILADLNGDKPGKKIALRADMDALSIKEETDFIYKSHNEGVMHACGHDVHTTCLLGAARLLSNMRNQLNGSVRLIFQPSEEMALRDGSRSSKIMIESGALENVDAIFGLHVWPDLPQGTVGCLSGPIMAACDHFYVTISGRSSHGAKPHEGIDALLIGAQFVNAVQSIISRNIDPMKPAVISIGKLCAGSSYNIIAEECMIEGTCRTFDNNVRDDIQRRLGEILDGICASFGAKGIMDYQRDSEALINSPAMIEKAKKSAAAVVGKDAVITDAAPSMTAEDFAFYLQKTPGAFLWLGTRQEGIPYYPLHSSHFQVNDEVLCYGAALLTLLAADNLNE